MTSEELFSKARRTIESRRQKAETDALERRSMIYANLPSLAMMDEKMVRLGTKASFHAAVGETQQQDENLREMGGLAKNREELLRSNGLSPEDMEPRYTCMLCRDSGRVGSRICQCVHQEVQRLRSVEIHRAGPLRPFCFQDFSLEYYESKPQEAGYVPRRIMEQVFQICSDYAADFGPQSENLFLFGDAGLGKTHLALSIANEVTKKGYNVLYVASQHTFSTLSRQRYDDNGFFSSLLNADLLVLDDLGTEYVDAYTLSRLYELVEGRLHKKPSIYTTNILSQDMLHQRYTEKIASRLLGECHLLRFVGKDVRLQKAHLRD